MKNLKTVFSFIIGFLIAAMFLEVYLKASEIKLPFKTLDPEIGKSYQANIPIHENKEGLYMGETNTFGFVGKTTLKKKPNVFRIAVFGDSFTEAFQLAEKYNFTKVMERKLHSNLNIKVEVLNFGMSNTVISEIYIRKKKLAEQFNIDLFLYFFDSYDFIIPPQNVINSVNLINKGNTLQIEKNKAFSYNFYKKIRPIIDNSSYLNLFLEGYILYQRGHVKPIILDKFYKKNPIITDYSYYNSYFEKLTKINKLILFEIEKEPSVFIFKESAEPKLIQNLKEFNIPVFETKLVLDELRNKGINPYYWELTKIEGHFNYEANETVGNYIANQLTPIIKDKIP